MKRLTPKIKSHVDIITIDNEDDDEGEITKWQDILIHGNPEGLKSLGRFLIRIAELNQDAIHDLPIGAREHFHLSPNRDLSKTSSEVIVGRLDAKGTGSFYDMYVSKDE
ncbi:Imm32 family immunity protein [Spirosoma endophyticum]|uniref:Uncharacterized protein n=1 Tax=Spirosoma endophyticum TaxID=662367 RepID=A0A1I1PA72_9BACT|nr:hypothetical protein [Spirosoma endophyticum]SFD02890.1 hypothetical protein SAMN05216167_10344 [Spirosoma endophyticum]